jgi:hypothetical protein
MGGRRSSPGPGRVITAQCLANKLLGSKPQAGPWQPRIPDSPAAFLEYGEASHQACHRPGDLGHQVAAVKIRLQSAPEAAHSAYTAAMGPAPDVVKMVEGLKDRARAAGRKEIQPALENARPVDVSPVISAIDEKLQPGINALLLNRNYRCPISNRNWRG